MRLTNIASDAILATIIAVVAAQNAEPAYGLIVLVPLVMTNPDLAMRRKREHCQTHD